MKLQTHIWKFIKLYKTALIKASEKGHTKIVKILLEQEGIDINAKNISLFLTEFISIILYHKIIYGNYSNYYIRHL